MSVDVLTFGLNHVSAPVAVRERVAFPIDVLKPALDTLRATFGTGVREAAILSTCNRTEIYCAAEPHVAERLPEWMADFNSLRSAELTPICTATTRTRPCAMRSVLPAVWTPWSWASPRFWVR